MSVRESTITRVHKLAVEFRDNCTHFLRLIPAGKRNEFGIWTGVSFDAPTWIGKTPDARFGNIGLRYGRVLAANHKLAFSWGRISDNLKTELENERAVIFQVQRLKVWWGKAFGLYALQSVSRSKAHV